MINFRFARFWAIFVARNKEFYRDPGAMIWTFCFPPLVVAAFAYMFSIGGFKPYKAAYWSENPPGAMSAFTTTVKTSNREEALDKLRHHKVHLVLDETADAKIHAWYNEDAPDSKVAYELLRGAISSDPKQLEEKLRTHNIKSRVIRYVDFLIPGLLAMNVLWMALWGVGWVIVRHRKQGILKRFKASPVTSFEYLLAQLLSRMLVLFVSGTIVFSTSRLIYPFAVEGSLLSLTLVYALGCLSIASIGLVIAARMTSEESASGLINLLTYPMMFLSEIWFSLEGSPDWVLRAAKFVPLWHMTHSMRAIMNEGTPLTELMPSILIMVAISAVGLSVGSFSFKWLRD